MRRVGSGLDGDDVLVLVLPPESGARPARRRAGLGFGLQLGVQDREDQELEVQGAGPQGAGSQGRQGLSWASVSRPSGAE